MCVCFIANWWYDLVKATKSLNWLSNSLAFMQLELLTYRWLGVPRQISSWLTMFVNAHDEFFKHFDHFLVDSEFFWTQLFHGTWRLVPQEEDYNFQSLFSIKNSHLRDQYNNTLVLFAGNGGIPIIESLESLVAWLRKTFMAQLIYANWKMIDFGVCVCVACVQSISVWFGFCIQLNKPNHIFNWLSV